MPAQVPPQNPQQDTQNHYVNLARNVCLMRDDLKELVRKLPDFITQNAESLREAQSFRRYQEQLSSQADQNTERIVSAVDKLTAAVERLEQALLQDQASRNGP
jgi:methyl-accepting chemotaxis protein